MIELSLRLVRFNVDLLEHVAPMQVFLAPRLHLLDFFQRVFFPAAKHVKGMSRFGARLVRTLFRCAAAKEALNVWRVGIKAEIFCRRGVGCVWFVFLSRRYNGHRESARQFSVFD